MEFSESRHTCHIKIRRWVETENGNPTRFISLISYEGSSLDPREIFIRSKMTDVLGAVRNHHGKILASFRRFPLFVLLRPKKLAEQDS